MKFSEPKILITHPSRDFALLDSGDGEKLERYGAFTVARPDPQALWKKNLPAAAAAWARADFIFARDEKNAGWKTAAHGSASAAHVPARWEVTFGALKFYIKPTAFKHVGVFAEQSPNWEWIAEKICAAKNAAPARDIHILNLFGYTGGATLAAAAAGARVTHVDGSKVAVTWARENAALSGLGHARIRWITDDARAFVVRERKRGVRYDGIIMDPPAFGHGPARELWKIERDFVPLAAACRAVMSPRPIFFLMNGYASGYSALAYENNLRALFALRADGADHVRGIIESGELAIAESSESSESLGAQNEKIYSPRLLPAGIFARWSTH